MLCLVRGSTHNIDFRHNKGGSTATALTAATMDRPYRWWTEASNIAHLPRRDSDNPQFSILPHGIAARCERAWEMPAAGAYRGQIIALTDRYVWLVGRRRFFHVLQRYKTRCWT